MRASTWDISRLAGACCGLGLAGAALAGPSPTYQILSRDLDFISPVGAVTSFANQAVNDSGSWIIELDTDHPDTVVDGALLKDGVLYIREGDPINPPGAAVGSFDAINLNSSGNSGWNFFLDNLTTGTDSGVYFNTNLLIQEGNASTATAFTPNTPYIGFFEARINDSNDMMVMASVDDPNIDSTVDRAIVLLTLDAMGNLASETVLYKEGDLLPGQTETVADFGTGPHAMAYNNAGQVMFVADLNGDTAVDGAVYIDHTLIAQEGAPSPLAGRNWRLLSSSTEVDLNTSGSYVISGFLDGDTASDAVIIKDGQLFRQESEEPPAIAPFALTSFGTGPVLLSDNGDVLWYGDWNDADTSRDTGLFINDELLLQEGVTMIDGHLVTTVRGITDGYAMSPSGRYIIVRVVLDGSTDAVVLIDRGEQGGPACPADWDGDEMVNSNDISSYLTAWLDSVQNGNLIADFDGDEMVNSNDISAFLTAWLDAVQNGC